MSVKVQGHNPLVMMNASNNISQTIPERIDLRLGNRPSMSDAKIEGSLVEQQHLDSGPKKGPGKELTAASALTSLVKPPVGAIEEDTDEFEIPQRFTKSGRKKAIPFPLKLMKVLSQKEYNDIITWLPDGKSFTILRPKAFVSEILPEHFKDAKYSSFTRKLHRWGFQRHLRGEEAGAFFHRSFQRGRLDLVEKMTCYKADQGKPFSSRAAAASAANLSFQDDPMMSRSSMARSLMMQQNQQMQHMNMQEQLRSPMSIQGGSGGDSSVDRLNAAIELEVNRRLKERIHAATLSRQALAMMQQQFPSNERGGFGGNAGASSNMSSLGLSSFLGGQDSLGLNSMSSQHQLQQLQQQQAQLQQQQQQLQQGMWGGQSSYAFDNQQGI